MEQIGDVGVFRLEGESILDPALAWLVEQT